MPGAVTHAVLRRPVPSMGLIIPWRWPGRPTNDDAEDEQEGEHADHAVLDEAAEDRADIGSAARLFGCGQERD
ncbi:hypothetical protein GCM10019016_037560 [Streptomyces prasinosporus]|uniref:Uncharacterized protein n=2 Tax=Streptomyces prasinosporus TaxID=68256 RepID=A0ABP6TPG5_9ACTN